ncbi:NAD(P)-dependent oxidoreductase [Amycolatopsis rhabdoformis]|uniref:NAD(P)-dependent oxidoreductase n=1 Tax=Amycolatopsis rhabdoformis TaxID=1448059 RepID=A0ABZ1IHB7_9PSEU|nr:NAD(P)-dependent oxidoreductase [Amycolatopsis rhabdoformis]WSE33538.1 NAD(P)-dependent oxidoreductase [Amycolatopsis rhabdoformis]
MRVLLTGDQGLLGQAVRAELEASGHDVRGFDLAAGQDVRDAEAVADAAQGHEVIVHLAGLPGDREERPDQVMAVNLLGTWNVLLAARRAGVGRVVYCSSGKALGMLERDPEYLPVDDSHPGRPSRPYALSKWLAEEMCEAFTHETGIATLCLRPVFVADEPAWRSLVEAEELPPARGTSWHLGAVVDVRDVAAAFAAAVGCADPGHARLLLCADEVASDRPVVEVARAHLPAVAWRTGAPGRDGRSALVDCAAAREVLGWQPKFGWRDRGGYLTP